MIKRRFFKIDHGDRDGSDHSSSSSDEDYDNNQVAQVSNDDNDDNDSDDEASSASSGYKSEDSSANDINANSVDANSAGLLSSEDDAGTINEREMITNKEFPRRNYEKSNVMAEKKPLPADIPSSLVLQIKSVFKCRICPRVVCLTEDTLRNHLQSKRHARSEKLHEKGRLKAMLNSDGEIEDQEVSDNEAEDAEKNAKGQKLFKKRFKKNKEAAEIQTEDTEDNTKKNGKRPKPYKKRFKKNEEVAEIQTEDPEDNTKKNDNRPKLHKKRLGKKKNYNANSRKQRSGKGSSKRSHKK